MPDPSPNITGHHETPIEARVSGFMGNLAEQVRGKFSAWFQNKPKITITKGAGQTKGLAMAPESPEKFQQIISQAIKSVEQDGSVSMKDLQAIIEESQTFVGENEILAFVESDPFLISSVNEILINRERLNVPCEQEISRVLVAYVGRYYRKKEFPKAEYRTGVKINYKQESRGVDANKNNPKTTDREAIVEGVRDNVISMVNRPHPQPMPTVKDGGNNPGQGTQVA